MELSIFKNRKSKKLAIIIFTIVLFLVVSFLAIYQTQFYDGKIWAYLGTSDDRFHMMRIEGLYHSIQRHQFFPIVNMTFMKGFGYIVNVFYSDFLLYPAAFLRLLGLTSAQTLMVYYVLLNFLTFGVSFLCFYKIQKKYWNSLVFSFVYTLSAYRLHDLAFRHDIGELGAFVFLPIAVLGIYEIFYGDNKKWLYLTAGMTTIIYSHAISPILVAILIVIVACCQIPELKVHPRRLLSLLWATLCSMLLSASYFLPMIEQLLHTHFMLTQSKVALPAGALSMSNAITWSLNGDIGQPNIGIVLLLAALVVLVSTTKIKNKAVKHFSIIGAVMFLCSTKIFPWIIVNYTPLKVIQYPWRLDMLISILLAIFIAADPLGIFKGKFAKGILVCAVFMITVASGYNLVNGNSTQLVSQAKYNQMEPFSIGAGKRRILTNWN
ncbi:hypothetical protein [Companilactobacillus halodurans]|uniref:YfhO family protein n=1 Tax=Companilactobacillus halodurans TaxID=2584183 RepID=A0A5P0ZX85_9LACO|nr:hypothetical protein [Companilactobacillus halodurans]MQS97344.1 YfhO family protein [Companilactobacillus halodurans]